MGSAGTVLVSVTGAGSAGRLIAASSRPGRPNDLASHLLDVLMAKHQGQFPQVALGHRMIANVGQQRCGLPEGSQSAVCAVEVETRRMLRITN